MKITAQDIESFHAAIGEDDLGTVRHWLEHGMPPETDHDDKSPLIKAAISASPAMINLLVVAGANPNRRVPSCTMRTALNEAALHGKLDSVEHLLNIGADPRSPSANQLTAAHSLVYGARVLGLSGTHVHRVCELLGRILDLGVAINQPAMNDRWTMLHLAVDGAVATPITELILDRGADPCLWDLDGFTPVHMAFEVANVEHLNMLHRRGISLGPVSAKGDYPLHRCKNPVTTDLILAYNPDLEVRDREGRTPLKAALDDWDPDATTQPKAKVIALIGAGASVSEPDYEGITPLDVIEQKGLSEVAIYVAARDARETMGRIGQAAKSARALRT